MIVLDPILIFNLIVCIIIVVLGVLCYRKSGDQLPIYIAAAFGLFGVSHAAGILGLSTVLPLPLIIDRAAGYLLVIFALLLYLRKSLIAKETTQAWVDFYREDLPAGTGDEDQKRKQDDTSGPRR